MRMSHRKIHQYQGGKTSRLSYPWNPSCQHLFSSPNLLQLLGTFDIHSKFLHRHLHHHWGVQALNNKQFPSTATMPLFQPSCISSRRYTSLDQWCHLVGRVASNVIMSYLVMRCKWVSGLVPWFRFIVSLLPSSKCLLPNERVVLVDIMGGREGQ